MYLNWQAANFNSNSTSLPYRLTTSVSTQKQQILQQNKASISCKLGTTSLQFTHTQLHCHFTTVSCKHFSNTWLQYNHSSLQYNHSSLQTIVLTESPTQWPTTVNRHLHSDCSTSAAVIFSWTKSKIRSKIIVISSVKVKLKVKLFHELKVN